MVRLALVSTFTPPGATTTFCAFLYATDVDFRRTEPKLTECDSCRAVRVVVVTSNVESSVAATDFSMIVPAAGEPTSAEGFVVTLFVSECRCSDADETQSSRVSPRSCTSVSVIVWL